MEALCTCGNPRVGTYTCGRPRCIYELAVREEEAAASAPLPLEPLDAPPHTDDDAPIDTGDGDEPVPCAMCGRNAVGTVGDRPVCGLCSGGRDLDLADDE